MAATTLTAAERRRLRGAAHALHPLAQVGRQGVSEPFLAEIDRALASHELIKIRLRGERSEREEQLRAIGERLGCATVTTVGGIAVLFRKGEATMGGDESDGFDEVDELDDELDDDDLLDEEDDGDFDEDEEEE
jgi:RNA-binding protein